MAKVLGIAKRTYASYERNERVPEASLLAVLIDEGWNGNWLLTGEGPERLESLRDKASAPSQSLKLENVKLAVQLLREALDDAEADLTPAKHGEAVVLLVQLLESGLPAADIRPLTRQTVTVITGDRVDAGPGKAAAGG